MNPLRLWVVVLTASALPGPAAAGQAATAECIGTVRAHWRAQLARESALDVARPLFPTACALSALDGGDPAAPVALEKEAGTPEFIKAKCPEGTSW